MSPSHRYRLCGLNLRSCFPLEALEEISGAPIDDDIQIRWGSVPEHLKQPERQGPIWESTADEFLFRDPNSGRYLIRGGREILIDKNEGASIWECGNNLVKSPLGALLHQNGLLPLHASALATEQGCILFVGNSGAGKSTMAASLSQRHSLAFIADDITALSIEPTGVRAHPGLPYARLWRDASAHLELAETYLPGGMARRKAHVRLAPKDSLPSLPIHAIYELHEHRPPVSQIAIQAAPSMDGIKVLLHNTYRKRFLTGEEQNRRYFQMCSQVANGVPIYRFTRPLDFSCMNDAMDQLMDHLNHHGG